MENQPKTVQNASQFPFLYQIQPPLTNATAVLVLGIMSIPTCFCVGIVGLVLSIIALVLASKDTMLYNTNPTQYTLASYNNLKAGKVCSIIGLCLSSIYVVYIVFMVMLAISSGDSNVDYFSGF